MKLHDRKRVHSDKIDVVLARNKLTTQKDDRFTHPQKWKIIGSDGLKSIESVNCNHLSEIDCWQ